MLGLLSIGSNKFSSSARVEHGEKRMRTTRTTRLFSTRSIVELVFPFVLGMLGIGIRLGSFWRIRTDRVPFLLHAGKPRTGEHGTR